jgi:hypothetical protein
MDGTNPGEGAVLSHVACLAVQHGQGYDRTKVRYVGSSLASTSVPVFAFLPRSNVRLASLSGMWVGREAKILPVADSDCECLSNALLVKQVRDLHLTGGESGVAKPEVLGSRGV